MDVKECDVAILGTGPAGITAAIYCKRFELETVLIGEAFGGAIARAHLIENYPGFPSISGMELMENFRKNLDHLGIEPVEDYVGSIEKTEDGRYKIETDFSGSFIARALIFCTGGEERKLNVPGEDKFVGRGVSYCATCDGPFFKGKRVGVVGGSDSAVVEALYLSELAEKVYIIYRRSKLRAEPINVKRVESKDNIEVIYNTNVVEILGDNKVTAVKFDNGEIFPLDAIFIEIGADPRSEMAEKLGVKVNEKKEIIVDEGMRTNVPGIFAAGDVINRREKQVVIAAGWGAIAAYSAREYINSLK